MTHEPQTFGYGSVRGEVRRLPLEWGDALPAAGDFTGHLYYLRVGVTGWYYWDGAIWMGPLGVSGGGGGAPVGSDYIVGSADPTLTNERVVTNTDTVEWDLGTAGQAKADVPVFSATKNGAVPKSVLAVGEFLRDDGTWAVPVDTGEVNTASNVGVGPGKVYRSKAGSDLELKSILGSGLISVTNLTNEVQIKMSFPVQGAVLRQADPDPVAVTYPLQSLVLRGAGDVDIYAVPDNTFLGRDTGDLRGMTVADSQALLAITTTPAASSVPKSDGSGFIPDGWFAATTINANKISLGGYARMVRTTWGGASPLAEGFDVTVQSLIGRKTATDDVEPIALSADSVVMRVGSADIAANAAPINRVLCRGPSGNLDFYAGSAAIEAMAAGFSGASFPTGNLFDGRPFWRTDLHMGFFRDSGTSGWLSMETFGPFGFGDNVDRTYGGGPFFLRTVTTGHAIARAFNLNKGYQLPFACKVVGITLNMAASGTCQVQVGDGTTPITGAVLVVTALQSESDFTLLSNTIPADGIMTVALTSGTIEGPSNGHFFVRRFET